MGNPFGPPNDPESQRAVLLAALGLAEQATTPGAIVDFATQWHDDFSTRVRDSLLSES